MWFEEIIFSKFSFLKNYGFEIQFLSSKKDTIDTMVSVIHNDKNYFVIKVYKNYPFEPVHFYRLSSFEEIGDIFKFSTEKEIQVYRENISTWKTALKKMKFLSHEMVFSVVAESIKLQIESTNSFYGIDIH